MSYHNGSDGKCMYKLAGGDTFTEAEVTKWDLTIKPNNKDVSNAVDGRKRIKGVQDAEGSISVHFDDESGLWDEDTGIRDGDVVELELIPDGGDGTTGSFRLTAIADDVHVSSEFEGTVDADFKFSLESGTVKYPGDT